MNNSANKTISLLKDAPPVADSTGGKSDALDGSGQTKSSVETVDLSDKEKSSAVAQGRGGVQKETFGKYKIIKEIARGGMGIVYRAHDPDRRKDLALKILLQGEGADEIAIKRFMREAQSAANLNHPNIITVHEMGEIEGQHFFTMDFIEGKSLQDYIEGPPRERLPPELFIEKVRDVSLALQTAHDQGIIHRDLKPANIMLRADDLQVVLMDFGLAKDNASMSIMSMSGAVMGSPAYMSPEQAQGRTRDIDSRSDIYSLGIVLYEGLTGKQPFVGKTIFETLINVVSAEPVPPRAIAPDAVPPVLQNIILKCMEKDPAKRYATMQELATDLEAYIGGGRVSARSIRTTIRLWRKIRRKPAALAAVVATPLVFTALAVGWFLATQPSYVEVAEKTLKTGNADRRLGALTELSAQLQEGKISKSVDKVKAFALIRRCCSPSEPAAIAGKAVEASARLADVGAVQGLTALARDKTVDETVRKSSLAALAEIGSKKQIDGVDLPLFFSEVFADKDIPLPVRLKAADVLSTLWGSSAIPKLADLAEIKDEPSELRVAALKALRGKIVQESLRMSELMTLVSDPDEKVSAAATEVCASARPTASVLGMYGLGGGGAEMVAGVKVVKMNADRQSDLMKMVDAMENRGQVKSPPVVDAMLAKLADNNPETRLAAAFDLGQLGDGKAVPELVKHIADPDAAVRGVAARAVVLLAAKTKPDMAEIRKFFDHNEMFVREQAVFVIGELADAASLKDLLKLAGQETSRRVQAVLAKAFRRINDPAALPVLKTMLDTSQEDSPTTAMACLKAIAAFENVGVGTLISALDSKNPEIRFAVAHHLKEISGVDYGEDKDKWTEWARNKP